MKENILPLILLLLAPLHILGSKRIKRFETVEPFYKAQERNTYNKIKQEFNKLLRSKKAISVKLMTNWFNNWQLTVNNGILRIEEKEIEMIDELKKFNWDTGKNKKMRLRISLDILYAIYDEVKNEAKLDQLSVNEKNMEKALNILSGKKGGGHSKATPELVPSAPEKKLSVDLPVGNMLALNPEILPEVSLNISVNSIVNESVGDLSMASNYTVPPSTNLAGIKSDSDISSVVTLVPTPTKVKISSPSIVKSSAAGISKQALIESMIDDGISKEAKRLKEEEGLVDKAARKNAELRVGISSSDGICPYNGKLAAWECPTCKYGFKIINKSNHRGRWQTGWKIKPAEFVSGWSSEGYLAAYFDDNGDRKILAPFDDFKSLIKSLQSIGVAVENDDLIYVVNGGSHEKIAFTPGDIVNMRNIFFADENFILSNLEFNQMSEVFVEKVMHQNNFYEGVDEIVGLGSVDHLLQLLQSLSS